MHTIVKLTVNEDMEPREPDWHLTVTIAGSSALFCSGEFYGFGEGNAQGEERTRARGGITCKDCLSAIRQIKAVKL